MTFTSNNWYRLMTSSSKSSHLSLVGTFPYMSGQKGLVTYGVTDNDTPSQQWQLSPVDSSTYMLRTKASGPYGYLATEKRTGSQKDFIPRIHNHTKTDKAMLWKIIPAGDGTFHLSNVANGNDFYLEFSGQDEVRMSKNVKSQPAQAFHISKGQDIEDPKFSSINTPLFPSTTSASVVTSSPTNTGSGSTTHERRMSTSTTTPEITVLSSPTTTFSSLEPSNVDSQNNSSRTNGLSQSAAMAIGAAIGVLCLIFLSAIGLFLFQYFRKRRPSPESLHYRRAKLWKGFTPQTPQSQFSDLPQPLLADENGRRLATDDNRRHGRIWIAELPVTPSTVLATPPSALSPPLSGGRQFSWQSWPDGVSPLNTPRTVDGLRSPTWPPVELPV